ncbi:sensor histidine kinase/response regulator [Parvularcula bermudensis HTCC2503]|uniref:histidine kinase n=1 Tax=Parvularcula bermudensis (strain ATCC BAA-594 / HTCC2503 / KCTC 12087) TaxID=314260 RepID=E0TGV3_PARBH|nr:hybrid sensor histidine kinase/response regulator [Parvularcula bermudensis]ADM10712.1 sensor histidine kinase/response regulator [Parvularcula bermudensis HTCC2503]
MKRTIFIVDDESYNRDIGARVVKRMGHDAETFADGASVIARIEETTPDAILLDIHMPRQNGLEVLKQLRQQFAKSALPILMVTADTGTEKIVEAFHSGANDYVTKPIDSQTLRARLSTHLELKGAVEQIEEFAKGAERLVAERTLDLQKRNEDLQREIRLRFEAERVLEKKKDAAERESEEKSEFLAILTHELKTPLNITSGFAELIAKDHEHSLSPGQCREYAGYIHDSSIGLTRIIEDILILSDDKETREEDESEISVVDLVASAEHALKPPAAERRITVEAEIDRALILRGNKGRLAVALRHILSNAVKFSRPGQTCSVTAHIREDFGMDISVIDKGIGMDDALLGEVLRPFRQVSSGLDRQFEGLGLGLPVTRLIVEQHGGTLTLSSRPGEGTTVTVSFPAERTMMNYQTPKTNWQTQAS